jgi:hypothetical protein
MAATGGSIESVTINGREFPATADSDVQRILGGFNNELLPNGDGTSRRIKTRVLPAFKGVVVECDDARADQEFLQDIADGEALVPIAVTYASGLPYQGRGTIVGELGSSNQSATASFDIMGEGKFTQQ